MANDALAVAARKAIHDPAFVSTPHCCQMFVREVIEAVYGDRYDDYRADTALHAAQKWQAAGLGKKVEDISDYPQTGDILYKMFNDGDAGHVGIYVGRIGDPQPVIGLVAENSSTSIGRVQGAKGYRNLSEFGAVDLVVRLPDPSPTANSPVGG